MDIRLCIVDLFRWMEDRDLRVGTIIFNPREIQALQAFSEFDRYFGPDPPGTCPGIFRGTIFGAHVREAQVVPEGRVAVIPEGVVLCDLGPAACVSLGLERPDI